MRTVTADPTPQIREVRDDEFLFWEPYVSMVSEPPPITNVLSHPNPGTVSPPLVVLPSLCSRPLPREYAASDFYADILRAEYEELFS